MVSWRGLDHRTLYEMVVNQGDGPEVSRAAEDGWRRILDVIVDVDSEITAAVRASVNEWQGRGADATRTALSPLAEWVLTAAADASRTATSVTEQAAMAANTRRLVAGNAPPQNFGEYLHDQLGSWNGHTVYDDQAAAVDQLMITYEQVSEDNKQRFDTWSVPPSVVVTPAVAGPSGPGGPGGGGVGAMPATGGLGPADGSGIASALAPGGGAGAAGAGGAPLPGGVGSPGAGGATPGAAVSGGGAGVLPGAVGTPPSGSGGTGGVGAPGAGSAGAGAGRSPGAVGGSGRGMPGPGTGAPGTGGGAAGAGRPGTAGSGTATGGRGLGTGGVAHPSQRPSGSPGGSGTGPGPWSRAAAEAGRSPAGATPFRPVVPVTPPRTSVPDWRSVLLPPERETGASTRPPGEAAARSAGPGAPGGSTATPAASAAPGSGPRGAGSPGMHAPMMGGGAGGAQPEGRRRASYLVDDSDAFVDKRWFTEPVITPDDPL